jgi:hypothetical protein
MPPFEAGDSLAFDRMLCHKSTSRLSSLFDSFVRILRIVLMQFEESEE